MITGAQIQSLHKDPFDRMIAGQALVDQLALISIDPAFKSLGVPAIW
jgi:PIN domain nuclease of toxin-antitoxin system